MIEVGNQLSDKLQVLVQNLGLVAVAAFLLIAFVVGRSLVKVLSVGIMGAIMLFGVFNPEWFKDKVGDDLGESGMAVVGAPSQPALDLSDLGVTGPA